MPYRPRPNHYSASEIYDGLDRHYHVKFSSSSMAKYKYLRRGMVVDIEVAELVVASRLHNAALPAVDVRMDWFNRVTNSGWRKTVSAERDSYRVELAYERDRDILAAEDEVQPGLHKRRTWMD